MSLLVLVSPLPVTAATMPVTNIVVGEVIAINGQKFVKIGSDGVKGSQFLALEQISWGKTYAYTGSVQTLTVPYAGTYQIELWGGSGGSYNTTTCQGGDGSYTAGEIFLQKGEVLHFYLGGVGLGNGTHVARAGGYNGGGNATSNSDSNTRQSSGGGASDVRLTGGSWNDSASLRSRLMIAGGGGGGAGNAAIMCTYGGTGGGLTAGNGQEYIEGSLYKSYGTGGNQTTGGSYTSTGAGNCGGMANGTFGTGAAGITGGGGGGYYGGGVGCTNGGGGSSYISGHTGSVAIISAANQAPKSGCTTGTTDINCSTHYSGKVFTHTVMIDGGGYAWANVKASQVAMPNPAGGNYALGKGHTGNGVAKITLVSCGAGYVLVDGTCWSADGMNMQDFTSEHCAVYPIPPANGYTLVGELKDSRDGKFYEVRKFADGKCWMADNLMYGGASDDCAGVDAAGYTDGYYGGGEGMAVPSDRFGANTYGNCRDPRVGAAVSSPCYNSTACGYYYNWQAATQLSSAYDGGTIVYPNGTPTVTANHVQGICPTGWHLPSGRTTVIVSEFVNLDVANGETGKTITSCVEPDCNFWRLNGSFKGVGAGYVLVNGLLQSQGSDRLWWSSSSTSARYADSLALEASSGNFRPFRTFFRYAGLPVRCIKN